MTHWVISSNAFSKKPRRPEIRVEQVDDPFMIGENFRPTESLLRALSGAPIVVGTRNRAKLEAVRLSFAAFAEPGVVLDLIPVSVTSGVSDQPIGHDEIIRGARNRARAAFDAANGEIAVGIEDGLLRYSAYDSTRGHEVGEGLEGEMDSNQDEEFSQDVFYNVGCAWVTDGERAGHGFSAGFSYPPSCRDSAVREQAPIGDLFDELWRARRPANGSSRLAGNAESARERAHKSAMPVASGRQGGNIGLLTQGRLDRATYGAQAVTCALIRFLHTDLYD
jgi:non-canonical (house-cleaning) NTP pyrophosphatase